MLHNPPQTALIVGAGMVGLATAWHLQEAGVQVTVLDREGIAAGSSWGNAGWLSPGMAMPLADSALWGYIVKSMLDPKAPLHIPLKPDLKLWYFLLKFASHATDRSWRKTMDKLTPIDKVALDAYHELIGNGVGGKTFSKDYIIAFENGKQQKNFQHEMDRVIAAGQEIPLRQLPDPQAVIPFLSDNISSAFALGGQEFIEPGNFVQSLADAVIARGGIIDTDAKVTSIEDDGLKASTLLADGRKLSADVVVLANGAWLPKLARKFGVKEPIQAGRGYSFSVATTPPIEHPVYFPDRRVACTPYEGRFRIAGTMEFRKPDDAFQPKRVDAIVNSVKHVFKDIDLSDRQDEWVGSRPVSSDGLPLIGQTKSDRVFVGGGHGMWGIVLGPASGKFLAQRILTGTTDPIIQHFSPLR